MFVLWYRSLDLFVRFYWLSVCPWNFLVSIDLFLFLFVSITYLFLFCLFCLSIWLFFGKPNGQVRISFAVYWILNLDCLVCLYMVIRFLWYVLLVSCIIVLFLDVYIDLSLCLIYFVSFVSFATFYILWMIA